MRAKHRHSDNTLLSQAYRDTLRPCESLLSPLGTVRDDVQMVPRVTLLDDSVAWRLPCHQSLHSSSAIEYCACQVDSPLQGTCRGSFTKQPL